MDIHDYELRRRIERVRNAAATDDQLVTLAIPPEKSLGEVLKEVEEDRAEAEYIDADESTTPIRNALDRVQRVLRDYEEIPDRGLVIYAGVVDDEVVEYVFDDLPTPVSEYEYVRANEFDAGPLDAAADSAGTFGLLVVERGGAALGLYEDDTVTPVETLDSDVPGKTKAGGQSADRFERERERQKEEFFEEVADEAERTFLSERAGEMEGAGKSGSEDESGTLEIDGLVLGGTAVTVDSFRESDALDHRLRDAVVGDPVAVEYASEQGLRQLARKAGDRIEDEERRRAREALDRFFEALDAGDDEGEVVYGSEATDEALTYDAVETALVSESLPVETVRDIADRTTDAGGECVVIPTDFERGERFAEAFGGIGALLRFPVE